MAAAVRGIKAFGHFWWDFLVGDTPELFVAVIVLVGLAFALRRDRTADVVVLPLLAIAALAASAWRGRARGTSRGPEKG
jgi:asparagine N-glycosylation enzyme membrane subunit Stt3